MSLPVELMDEIFPYCARGDLYRISLTCRLFSSMVRPLLYKNISLDQPASVDLFLTLCCARSSHISRLVQSLRIVVLGDSMRKRLSNKEIDKYLHLTHGPKNVAIYELLGYCGPERYFQALNVALRRLRQLRVLDIEIHGAVSPKLQLDLTERLFEGCIFRLRTFKTNLSMDFGLTKFLRTQPDLKSLRLMHNTKDQASHFPGRRRSIIDLNPNSSCLGHPSLRTLTVSDLLPQETINYIYRVGNIKEFNILFLNPINKRDYLPPCLKGSLSRGKSVKHLSVMYLNRLIPAHFNIMASHMPNVQRLELKASVFDKETLKQMTEALGKFTSLKTIHLSSHSFRPPYNHDGGVAAISSYRQEFQSWFSGCDELNVICLPQFGHRSTRGHSSTSSD